MAQIEEPKGIAFFNIKSGDTHYCRLEPTIQAYINSSDMGINASRGQDFGWRLAPEWVKRVRAFRADEEKVDSLAAKLRLEDGVAPNTTQILYYIYGRQMRRYLQTLEDNDNPFAEQYQQEIADRPKAAPQMPPEDTITETVDEADLMPAEDEPVADEKPAEKPKDAKKDSKK